MSILQFIHPDIGRIFRVAAIRGARSRLRLPDALARR